MTTRTSAALDGNSRPTLTGVSSSDGVTVIPVAVDQATGRVLVDVAGSLAVLAATGTVDGSNTAFTFTSAPSIIISDQGRMMQKTSSDGTVNWTGTTSITLSVAPNFDVYGLG